MNSKGPVLATSNGHRLSARVFPRVDFLKIPGGPSIRIREALFVNFHCLSFHPLSCFLFCFFTPPGHRILTTHSTLFFFLPRLSRQESDKLSFLHPQLASSELSPFFPEEEATVRVVEFFPFRHITLPSRLLFTLRPLILPFFFSTPTPSDSLFECYLDLHSTLRSLFPPHVNLVSTWLSCEWKPFSKLTGILFRPVCNVPQLFPFSLMTHTFPPPSEGDPIYSLTLVDVSRSDGHCSNPP